MITSKELDDLRHRAVSMSETSTPRLKSSLLALAERCAILGGTLAARETRTLRDAARPDSAQLPLPLEPKDNSEWTE